MSLRGSEVNVGIDWSYPGWVAAFEFEEPENLAVFVCHRVLREDAPILHVVHDGDGDWQFLCDGDHGEAVGDEGLLVCLRDIVEKDATVNQLARLCPLSHATRARLGDEWVIHDDMEDIVRENVARHGCHVMKVDEDDEGAGFAYSIGLTKNYGQPELICFGLRPDVMHAMINAVRDRMAQGERFDDAARVGDLIEGFDCVMREVSREHYREYFGYALWFYDGPNFEALQVVWPDRDRRFPWDDGYSAPPSQQPRTWEPAKIKSVR